MLGPELIPVYVQSVSPQVWMTCRRLSCSFVPVVIERTTYWSQVWRLATVLPSVEDFNRTVSSAKSNWHRVCVCVHSMCVWVACSVSATWIGHLHYTMYVFTIAHLGPVHFLLPDRQSGIHCLIICGTRLSTPNNLGATWRRICLLDIHSAVSYTHLTLPTKRIV